MMASSPCFTKCKSLKTGPHNMYRKVSIPLLILSSIQALLFASGFTVHTPITAMGVGQSLASAPPLSQSPRALFSSAAASTRDSSNLDSLTTQKESDTSAAYDQKGSLPPQFDWNKQWYPTLPVSFLAPEQENNDVDVNEPPSKPKQVTILGRKLVIWNNGNKDNPNQSWSVMADVCPHRRARLSTGRVSVPTDTTGEEGSEAKESSSSSSSCNSQNTLVCRFHGWEFDSTGACTKIPMQTSDSTKNDPKDQAVYRAVTFPSRVAGGLVWVYMDEHITLDALPDIPTDALPSDPSNIDWVVTVHPISYMSMIENSFDPAHAPFIHEGTRAPGGMVYSPSSAVPMEEYQVKTGTNVTVNGFTLEHTPYMAGAPADTKTTRQFIPPCTQVTKSQFFSVGLYFVPSTPRQTIGLFYSPNQKPKNDAERRGIHRFLPGIPKRFKNLLMDFTHYRFMQSKGFVRFNAQDQITMQGQDWNKHYTTTNARNPSSIGNGVVLDIAPTPSDKGVSTFQRWVKRYAGHGPFGGDGNHRVSATSAATSAIDAFDRRLEEEYQPQLSSWDSHIKYCPLCQRSIKRFHKVSILTRRASIVSFASTVVFGILTKKTSYLKVMYLALSFSLAMRWISDKCRKEVENAFVTNTAHKPVHDFLMEAYH